MTEAQKDIKISTVLLKGLTVMDKVTSKDMTLNKGEMIDLLNFETAVRYIIDAEQKAELARSEAAQA